MEIFHAMEVDTTNHHWYMNSKIPINSFTVLIDAFIVRFWETMDEKGYRPVLILGTLSVSH